MIVEAGTVAIVGVVAFAVATARTIAIVKTATVAVVLASVVVAAVAVTVNVPSGNAVGCAVVVVIAVAVCGTALGADDGVDDRAAADGKAQSLAMRCLLDVERLVASRSKSVLFVARGGLDLRRCRSVLYVALLLGCRCNAKRRVLVGVACCASTGSNHGVGKATKMMHSTGSFCTGWEWCVDGEGKDRHDGLDHGIVAWNWL